MFQHLKSIITRTHPTLIEDGLGALSLVLMLVGVLYLPGFF